MVRGLHTNDTKLARRVLRTWLETCTAVRVTPHSVDATNGHTLHDLIGTAIARAHQQSTPQLGQGQPARDRPRLGPTTSSSATAIWTRLRAPLGRRQWPGRVLPPDDDAGRADARLRPDGRQPTTPRCTLTGRDNFDTKKQTLDLPRLSPEPSRRGWTRNRYLRPTGTQSTA